MPNVGCIVRRMAFGGGPNPGIWADAVGRALNPGDQQGAIDRESGVEQTLLDIEELRALERSELYGATPPAPQLALQPARPRSFLARILRRRG
jgi:hypothetical protein